MEKDTKYSQQFKEDAVQYRLNHPELSLRKIAQNLGVSESALKNWMKAAKEHKGEVPTRGSGNYASEEAKEIARLQRELRDTKDALEVLKKQSVFWKTDLVNLFCNINTEKMNIMISSFQMVSDTHLMNADADDCSNHRHNQSFGCLIPHRYQIYAV